MEALNVSTIFWISLGFAIGFAVLYYTSILFLGIMQDQNKRKELRAKLKFPFKRTYK
jgi:hypothetical protein